MEKYLISRGKKLRLVRTLIMGVINVTPDSFSDGGRFLDEKKALNEALKMVEDGADIIDIGGESTGPGSKKISASEELKRVIPVIKKLRDRSQVWISVDTYKAAVAQEVLQAGADMINDVTALRGDGKMAEILSGYDVPVVIMYSKDKTARTTLRKTEYKNVLKTVSDFLAERVDYAVNKGISRRRLIIDPGMGAFLSMDEKYSLQILKHLDYFKKLKLPVLAGASRKSFIGKAMNLPVEERLEGSLACAAVAIMNGADILRVHDVRESRRVADMVYAIKNS